MQSDPWFSRSLTALQSLQVSMRWQSPSSTLGQLCTQLAMQQALLTLQVPRTALRMLLLVLPLLVLSRQVQQLLSPGPKLLLPHHG